MRVAGIDSAKKGVQLFFLPDQQSLWIPRQKNLDFESLLIYYGNKCEEIKCDKVFLEDVTYVRNYRATIEAGKLVGAITYAFARNGIPVETVNNMTWKKFVLKGNATKQDIVSYVVGEPMLDSLNDPNMSTDLADAACIALYGYRRSDEN